jgi:hypothetical protein
MGCEIASSNYLKDCSFYPKNVSCAILIHSCDYSEGIDTIMISYGVRSYGLFSASDVIDESSFMLCDNITSLHPHK